MHIGFIMDGNGRFATAKGEPRLVGHRAGVDAVKRIVRACPELGIDTVSLFAFAIANWKRDTEEVNGLWLLFSTFFENEIEELIQEGVRVSLIGNREGLPTDVRSTAERAEKESCKNTRLLLQIALNYDGIDEIARMVQRTLVSEIAPKSIDTLYVKNHLDTEAGNEPDIVIRTGMPAAKNKMAIWRSSGFLPIQSAQSVCVATEVLWPDFTPKHLQEIIAYADPDARLFGGQRK